jgi:hypothetical protein
MSRKIPAFFLFFSQLWKNFPLGIQKIQFNGKIWDKMTPFSALLVFAKGGYTLSYRRAHTRPSTNTLDLVSTPASRISE